MTARRTLLAAAALLAAPRLARAQDQGAWPTRPIRVVTPYAPGGQSDTVIRLLQPKMAEALGQPLVIENRTGAGGSIGAGLVAAAPADGYTLLFESFTFVVVPLIQRGLTFDYETAFAPIGQAVALPYVLAVKRDLPARTLAEFVALAKARPGIAYGTPGVGTPGHLAGGLLASRAGIRLEHVPYRGGADAARDLAAGTLDCALATANSLRPIIQDGRAHGIGLTSATRRGTLAELPTFAESGFPGFDITSWNGLFAPAATPQPVREKLEAALASATRDEPTRQRLALTGNDAVTESSADFAARIQRDRATVRQLVQEAVLRVE